MEYKGFTIKAFTMFELEVDEDGELESIFDIEPDTDYRAYDAEDNLIFCECYLDTIKQKIDQYIEQGQQGAQA